MNKKELFDQIMKLERTDRKDLASAILAEFSAEEISAIVSEKAPQWSSTAFGKAVIGTIAAAAGIIAGYFINKDETPQLPPAETPVEVQPAIIQ